MPLPGRTHKWVPRKKTHRFRLPEENDFAKRVGSGNPWLGREWYNDQYGDFDEFVWAERDILLRSSTKQRPFVLDIGGASGWKAMKIAAKGPNVQIIDRVGYEEIIEERNKRLFHSSRTGKRPHKRGKGKIDLKISNAEALDSAKLKMICRGKSPDMIVISLVAHFMDFDRFKNLLNALSEISKDHTVLALQYLQPGFRPEKGIKYHDPKNIATAAHECGFELIHNIWHVEYAIQGFRLNKPDAPTP